MLKRELAPFDSSVWNEIDIRAEQVLKSYLSARKVVNVQGPKGWNFTAISDGRLNKTMTSENKVSYATYNVIPLVEARIEFTLNRWELDNILRGAKNIDLKPLEDAVTEIAVFEEDVIYNGMGSVDIRGLTEEAGQTLELGTTEKEILENISEGVLHLNRSFLQRPFTLIVGTEVFKLLNSKTQGYPLINRIEKIIGGNVIKSHVLEGALLLPYDHEDLELTIGNDFSIGYQSSDNTEVKFFVTESFTFRVLNNDIIVRFRK